MGIGRRNFLKLASLALAGLTVDPLQAVVTNENIYVNKKLGILLSKPKNWGFINIKEFGKLKDEQILGNGYDEIKDEVYENLGEPILIATKYWKDLPQYKGVFSPTITLHITPKSEFEEWEIESFEELRDLSAAGTAKILKEFKILKKQPVYKISNCNVYEYDAEYLFEHVELKEPLKVELKSHKS
jgi:hypothetical protein